MTKYLIMVDVDNETTICIKGNNEDALLLKAYTFLENDESYSLALITDDLVLKTIITRESIKKTNIPLDKCGITKDMLN